MNTNKITSTKIGDDIHFYVNGTEDRGVVVKMNNEYVTVFKESTQAYDDIHINDTFFIKDILVNKEWNKMDDVERYDALKRIHAPSPRFISKVWEDLPKDIKELLQKNNAIETSHKEGKDDDMNNVNTREFDKALNNRGRPNQRNVEGKDTKLKPSEGEDKKIDSGEMAESEDKYSKNPEQIVNHGLPEAFTSIDEKRGQGKGDKNVAGHKYLTEGGDSIGAGEHKLSGQSLADAQEVKFGKQQGRKEQGKKDDEVTAGVSALKAWQLWLAKREQEVLKDDREAARAKETERDAKGTARQRSLKLDEAGAAQAAADKLKPKKAAWKSWLDNQKSNTERSIHGNAGREPNSGVNTNTGFDASEDYEGFSHAGLRPEQFKHEKVKPKVTTKERINIGDTAPSKPSAGTGDGGNPYNTTTQNKDVKGRAVAGKDKK